jgi:short-subunit dehydrogenase
VSQTTTSLIDASVPLRKATARSLCLSTASASAIFGTADLAVYSATQHAVKGLTEALHGGTLTAR